MSRNKNYSNVIICIVGTLSLVMGIISCSQKKHRNILLIMTDDHAYQAISSYGSVLNKTPNIDKLAEEGVLFNQSFVTNSICGPSRACMLTGKYNHLNGMLDNRTSFDGTQQTFPKLLQNHDYQTAIVGKWHLKSEPTGFDYWNILPGQGHYYNPDFIEMGNKKRVEGYVTDLTTDFALEWLDSRDKSKPFCLLLHQKAPHRNWMPGPKHLNKFDDIQLPLPETFFDDYKTRSVAVKEQTLEIDDDMFMEYDLKVRINEDEKELFKNEKIDDTWWVSIYDRMTEKQRIEWDNAYEDKNEKFKKSNLKGEELAKWKYQRYIKDYLRCVESVDENVGRVLEYLEENNLDENTVVVYTSDQGFYLGEHGWFDKRFMYEQSFRTPLIIRTPDGIKGKIDDNHMVVNIDYAPTILDYAGISIPEDMQGKSLRQILNGESPDNWRNSVYYHYFEYPAEHGVKRHYGIRNAQYKLIHFYYDIDEWELYDLKEDPNEINNIYSDAAYEDIKKELKLELGELRKIYRDTDVNKYLPKKNVKIQHKGLGATVQFKHKFADKYSGGDKNALFDGCMGPDTMTSFVDYSIWQGFEKNDLIALIDFGKEIQIEEISAGFLQNLESWIFLPDYVEYKLSEDNNKYIDLGMVKRKSNIKSTKLIREEYSLEFNSTNTRYLKILAKNVGFCPEWHQGSGGPAWIFADEVKIK